MSGSGRVAKVTVTFATRPEPDTVLSSFYARVRPGGPGWRPITDRLGVEPEAIPGGWVALSNWFAGIVAVYATLFGIGKLIFGATLLGLGLLALALLAFLWIARSFKSEPIAPASSAAADERTLRAA